MCYSIVMIDILVYQVVLALILALAYGYALHRTTNRFMWHLVILLTAPIIAAFLGLTAGLIMVGLIGLVEIAIILDYSRKYSRELSA